MSRKKSSAGDRANDAVSASGLSPPFPDLSVFDPILSRIRSDRIVADLEALVAIPSINPWDDEPAQGTREAEVAAWYAQQLSALELDVSTYEVAAGRPNVWAVLEGEGEGPALAFAGHFDTVGIDDYPDALTPRVADGRVYGRGACDMKGALAAYLEVIRVLRECAVALRGKLIIAGTVDEEWRLLGSCEQHRRGYRADFAVVGEPTDLHICPSHKGEYAVAIRTFGKAVHASVPEHGHNAIDDMALVLSAFADMNDTLRQQPAHHLCGHGRFSVGTIRGGTLVATVPDFCEIEVDRRTVPGETGEDVAADYRERLERIARQRNDFRYELGEPLIDLAPLETSLEEPALRSLSDACQWVTGAPAQIDAFPAGTDGPNFGFPAAIFGPGSLEQAHSLNEYVRIEQLEAAAKVYLLTALQTLAATAREDPS